MKIAPWFLPGVSSLRNQYFLLPEKVIFVLALICYEDQSCIYNTTGNKKGANGACVKTVDSVEKSLD
jgi:hypothetical protein